MEKYDYESEVLKAAEKYKFPLHIIPYSKQTKRIVLAAVRQLGENIEYADPKFYRDNEILMEAVKHGLISYSIQKKYANPELYKLYTSIQNHIKKIINENINNEDELVKILLTTNGALKYIPKSKQNFNIVHAAVKRHGYNIIYAKNEFSKNREIIYTAIHNGGIEFVDDKIIDNDFFLLNFASMCQGTLFWELKDWSDRSEVLSSVQTNGSLIYYATEKLKKDPIIIKAAVKSNGYALKYVPENYKKDKKLVLLALKSNHRAIHFVNKRLLDDKEVAQMAIKGNGGNILYVGEKLQNDKNLILEAVKTFSAIFLFYDKKSPHVGKRKSILDDENFVIKCLKKNGDAAWSLPEINKKYYMTAIKSGMSFATYEYLDAREIEKSLSDKDLDLIENTNFRENEDDREYFLNELQSERFRDVIYKLPYTDLRYNLEFAIDVINLGFGNYIFDYLLEEHKRDPEVAALVLKPYSSVESIVHVNSNIMKRDINYRQFCSNYDWMSQKLINEPEIKSNLNKIHQMCLRKKIEIFKGKYEEYHNWKFKEEIIKNQGPQHNS